MRVIIEMMLAFTHDVVTDWMLPRVATTGRWVELPPVVVVRRREGQVVCERIYRDNEPIHRKASAS